MTEAAGIDGTRTSDAHGHADGRAEADVGASMDAAATDARFSRAILGSAIVAMLVLVLLMPATPLVAFVLIAATALGAVAVVVRRAEDRRSTGESLERLTTRGYLVLADRRSPALTGTIGHLVVGPGGVFVIETRDHAGRARIRDEQLVIGGHSYDVASQLRAQVAAVAATLAPILDGTGATVVPLVCMRQAELPLLHRDVAGIPLLRESRLARRIARTRPLLDADTIARLGEHIDTAMPEVARRRPPASDPDTQAAASNAEPVTIAAAGDAFGYPPESMTLSAS